MPKEIAETPLMKQYLAMKAKHPDAILLFRVGDFYETFSQDAITASEILGITLTKRANGYAATVELAGFPHHALDTYLPKLVRAGKRVAICEQLEDPKLTKKLVKRGITELVTPGVATTDNVLENRENNFVAAINRSRENWGLALLDISTGEFLATEGGQSYISKLISSFAPKEILVERGNKKPFTETFHLNCLVSELDDWIFTFDAAMERLLKHFKTSSLKGFGIESMQQAIISAGAILHYLDITCHTNVSHIAKISRIDENNSVRLDNFTIRNLEILFTNDSDGLSLLKVLDKTSTPMGARMLRRWLLFPLVDTKEINRRLDVTEYFVENKRRKEDVEILLKKIGDLERLTGKIATRRIGPRELLQIGYALSAVEPLKKFCLGAGEKTLIAIGNRLETCDEIRDKILKTIVDDPPVAVNKGNVIRRGVSSELDELRELSSSAQEYLERLRVRETERTGITSLKVGFNNIYGYYIEVTNTHKAKVPPEWIRRQTLVNAERYITPELKEYEDKILGARDRISVIETDLYNELVKEVSDYIPALQSDSVEIARLDALISFATAAINYRYNRPEVNESLTIDIVEGRHPVIERQLPAGEPYISNSVRLSNEESQILMITGPNMAGKSALLRQVALITLMAQAGSFVPADRASIGVVDKIFTRVGASDNISLGESTFMVEMNEAASILNNMSDRSLILFDELGRGTSTYDGLSIAWAIVEYLHQNPVAHPKTLFATHYHELNEMEQTFKRIINFNVSVKEINKKVIFLRKLARGGSEHSFGIHVARLAGMPKIILSRAEEILHALESQRDSSPNKSIADTGKSAEQSMQLSFFQLDDPVLKQVRDEIINLDFDNLTPMAALNKLHDIKGIITGKQ
ncbi:MAG: DNA mismatch repair protein MutS [Muribaculaceae bacterium]|nr:DNA mismatch repair protein MutS [Muribaculaceae bacterium]